MLWTRLQAAADAANAADAAKEADVDLGALASTVIRANRMPLMMLWLNLALL